MTNKGFTLLELMVSFSIATIAITIALPSINDWILRHRVTSEIRSLHRDLQNARHQAIFERQKISLCPRLGSNSCGTDWSQGRHLFSDANGNGSIDEEDRILVTRQQIPGTDSLRWKAFAAKAYIQWLPTGITNHMNGSFVYCGRNRPEFARAVIVAKSGRTRFSEDSNDDGIDENASGKALTCP